MSQIATVKSISGTAFVVGLDGQTRPLKAGDTIQKGETIVTSADGRVELTMEGGGEPLAVGPAQTVKVEDSVAEATRPEPQQASTASGTVDSVIQALEQGGDLNQQLEATAAGAGAGGGGGGGSSFVRLLRVSEGTDPLAYQYATERPDLEQAPLSEGETLPVLTLDFGGVFESSLNASETQSPGSNEPGTSDSTSGSFTYQRGSTGGETLVVIDRNGTPVDVTNGGVVQGQYGLMTITPVAGTNTYNWTYQLDGNVQHGTPEDRDNNFDGSFEDDTLPESFSFEVRSSNGSVLADGQLVITIGDDGPEVRVNNNAGGQEGEQEVPAPDFELRTDDRDVGRWGFDYDRDGVNDEGANVFQIIWGADGPMMRQAPEEEGPREQEGGNEGGIEKLLVLSEDDPSVSFQLTLGEADEETGLVDSGLVDNETNQSIFLFLTEDGRIEGRAGGAEGPLVFRLSVGEDNGVVTLKQFRAIEHDVEGQGDYIKYLATGAVQVSLTAVDSDGDRDSASFDLGGRIGFTDDKPSVRWPVLVEFVEEESVRGVGGNNEWWDGLSYKANGSILGAVNWGADEFGSVTGVKVGGVPVGVGETVYFDANGVRIVTDAEGVPAGAKASLVVREDGSYSIRVLGAMDHSAGWDENLALLPKVDITAVDGDGDAVSLDLFVKVQDDVPENVRDVRLVLEEESNPVLNGNNEPDGLSYTYSGNLQGQASWGADGFGGIVSVKEGYKTYTATDGTINIFFNNKGEALPPGSTSGAVKLSINAETGAFTITVDAALKHKGWGEDFLNLDSLDIYAKDGDGDLVKIDFDVKVQDDVPTVKVSLTPGAEMPSLQTDDGLTIGSNSDSDSGNFSGLFNVTHSYGADSAGATKTVTYTLSIKSIGVETGLFSDGVKVKLYMTESGDVVGKAGNAWGAEIFRISVNNDGEITLTQHRELDHNGESVDGDAFNNDKNLLGLASDLVKLTATAKVVDGDGDVATDSETKNIGGAFSFVDDVPTINAMSAVAYKLTVTNIDQVSSAGYDNSFGYYVLENGVPVAGVVIWDNVKDFDTSSVNVTGYTPEQIGFFIIPNGNNANPGLAANTPVTFQLVDGKYQAFMGTTPLTGADGAHVLFDKKAFNADGKDHATDNGTAGNLNWEDINGGGDNDYNDVNIQVGWSADLPDIVTDDALTIGSASDSASASLSGLFSYTYDMGADDDGSISQAYALSIGAGKTNTGLSSDGHPITLSMVGGEIVGSANGSPVFSISVNSSGLVTLTQFRELDHTGESDDGSASNNSAKLVGLLDGTVLLTMTATITDGDGDKASDSQTIDVSSAFGFKDDLPEPAPKVTNEVTEGGDAKTNVMIILDRSGSMGTGSGDSVNELALAKTAILNLLTQYDNAGDVRVNLVSFSDNATPASGWLTASAALSLVNALTAGGYTDYDDALAAARLQSFTGPNALTGAGVQNAVYFISDGKPNPSSDGIDSGEKALWETWLKTNDAVAYAIGIGAAADVNPGLSDDDLDPIAYNGVTETDTAAIEVLDPNNLSAVLLGTASTPATVTGFLVAAGHDFGADGPGAHKVLTITFAGVTYSATDAHANSTLSGDVLTITPAGDNGKLVVNLATGAYTYTAPGNVPDGGAVKTFDFTIVDGDGDSAPGQLVIDVKDRVPTAVNDENTAKEGYLKDAGGDVKVEHKVKLLESDWSDKRGAAKSVDIDDEIQVSSNNGSKSNTSDTFTVKADASHTAKLTVTFDTDNWDNNDDEWKIEVFKFGSANPVIVDSSKSSSDVSKTYDISSDGTYYVKLSVKDNSGGDKAKLDDVSIKIASYTYDEELVTKTIKVEAPTTQWVAGVAATGNLLSNDQAGGDGGLHVTLVAGMAVTAAGITVVGTHGDLFINAAGQYTYTPKAENLLAGASETFSYTVEDADGSPSTATLTIGIDQRAYTATSGDDVLAGDNLANLLEGLDGDDRILGGAGNDTLQGGKGTDILEGGEGADLLQGGDDSDALYGNLGADTLEGGKGNDLLFGGADADVFKWSLGDQGSSSSPAVDVIMDFNRSEGDKIDLRDLLQGENSGNLGSYLSFSNEDGHAVLNISHQGNGQVTQKVVFENMSLTQLQNAFSDVSGSDLIQKMKNAGSLNTD